MNKIGQKLTERCNSALCCANEFLILPANGDAGFEEYFARKAKSVFVRKNLFTKREEQTQLILKYPSSASGYRENSFSNFFASPEVVACNQPFEGCFGIDLTDYLFEPENPLLEQLIVYIKSNPSIVFVIFVYVDDAQKAQPLLKQLDQYVPLQMLQIPLPGTNQLMEYFSELIGKFCPFMDSGLAEEIRSFFAEKPVGFDTVEFLARELDERTFRGEREILLDTLKYLKSCTSRSNISIGFT